MIRAGFCILSLLGPVAFASGQDARESWKVGVVAATGFPPALGAVRLSAALGPTTGIDFFVGRMAGYPGGEPGDGFGPVFATHVRWMRGGRSTTGDSRYWVFGVLATTMHSSTLIIYPGGVRRYLVDDHAAVGPRVGYGWDHITRRGTRVGAELTTGAIAEETPVVFASVFLLWGPPRR
jgi:hypothetical protein